MKSFTLASIDEHTESVLAVCDQKLSRGSMQHTPGPWRIYQERPFFYSIGTDYAKDRGHDQNIVRDVREEANARLMAAAPEMLEALEALHEISGEAHIELKNAKAVRKMGKFLAAREKAEAAIRKARGGK